MDNLNKQQLEGRADDLNTAANDWDEILSVK
jgi:hypothetical protein